MNRIASERVKALLYFIAIFLMGMAVAWGLMDGMVTVQEQREASTIEKIDNAKVGSFIRVGDSGLLKMSQRRAK